MPARWAWATTVLPHVSAVSRRKFSEYRMPWPQEKPPNLYLVSLDDDPSVPFYRLQHPLPDCLRKATHNGIVVGQ